MSRALVALAAAALVSTADAEAGVLTVDCVAGPFPTIGAAVAAAANGDTIVVHPCVYNENVVISGFDDLHLVAARRPSAVAATALTGAIAVGVAAAQTSPVIVDGVGLPGACIHIDNSMDVSVDGFLLRRCSSGVEVFGSESTVIVANRLERHTFAGFFEAQSKNTRFVGNLSGRNPFGIYLEGTYGTTVADNRILGNQRAGIFIAGDRVQVVNNEVSATSGDGINAQFGNEARIERNTVLNNNLAGWGTGNIVISAGMNLADVIGNNAAGSIFNFGVLTDLAENM